MRTFWEFIHRFIVILGLFLWLAVSRELEIDISSYDDLSRMVLAKEWAARPFLFTSDMYWLPWPSLLRGVAVRVSNIFSNGEAGSALLAIQLVGFFYLWGIWSVLTACIRKLGGCEVAVVIFSVAFALNAGSFELAASAYSEADYIFLLSLALWLLLNMERSGQRSFPCALGIGTSLALANLTRYEAWFISAAIIILLVKRDPRKLKSSQAWVAMVIALLPILLWLCASGIRLGAPVHFLAQEAGYAGEFETSHSLTKIARVFLKLNPLICPLVLSFGIAEMFKHRREIPGNWSWVILIIGLTAAGAFFALWRHQAAMRFGWIAMTMLAVPGALGIARGIKQLRWPWVAVGIGALLSCAYMGWSIGRRQSFLPNELRWASQRINERDLSDGKILILDYSGREHQVALQTFRVFIDYDKLIPCEWIGACEFVGIDAIKSHYIRLILARKFPEGPRRENPDSSSFLGWQAWRIYESDFGPDDSR